MMNIKQKNALEIALESNFYIKHKFRKDKVLDIYFSNELMIQISYDCDIYYVFNKSAYDAIEMGEIRSVINIIY